MFIFGVNVERAYELCGVLGMKKRDLPVRYLRVPLISTRLKDRDCEAIKGKILKRVQSWASKAPSYAGRVQLAINVLHSI